MAVIQGSAKRRLGQVSFNAEGEVLVNIAPSTVITYQQIMYAMQAQGGLPSRMQDTAAGFLFSEIASRLSEVGEHSLQLPPELLVYVEAIAAAIRAILD